MAKGIPTDSLFNSQWYLGTGSWSINVQDIWMDYTGEGVTVSVIDEGFDYLHPDLSAPYRTDLDYDYAAYDSDAYFSTGDTGHGTNVMGIISGDDNGTGIVGVAFDSELVGYKVDFSTSTLFDLFLAFSNANLNSDIINNSWGTKIPFADDFGSSWAILGSAIKSGAENGRGNLGQINIFAAGNLAEYGASANTSNLANSPYTITVGALGDDGKSAGIFDSVSLTYYKSNPGANVLISAPGENLLTSDIVGAEGYSSTDFSNFGLSSGATAVISGVTALMLEANPYLGYRDVQEILALTARKNDPSDIGWQTNGSGLHFNHQYGFGIVDAKSAVRLAETWTLQQTYSNAVVTSEYTYSNSTLIPDLSKQTIVLNVTEDIIVEQAILNLNFSHSFIGDLFITLTSPDGTESVILDRLLNGSYNSLSSLDFEFSSVAHWGEQSLGNWQISIEDAAGGDTGTINNISLSLIGKNQDIDNLYVFTNERLPGNNLDNNGGNDTVNLSAIDADFSANLMVGTLSASNEQTFSSVIGANIENIITGDGNDFLQGSTYNNILRGGRGNDTFLYDVTDNANSANKYYGDKGLDILKINFSPAQFVANVWDDLLGFLGFLDTNSDENELNGAGYTFSTMGLAVSDFEALEVYVDGALQSEIPTNTPPVAVADDLSFDVIDDGSSITGNVLDDNGNGSDFDPDGGPISVIPVEGGTSAEGAFYDIDSNGNFTYTPPFGFTGQDSFSYTIIDDGGLTSETTVRLVINQLNPINFVIGDDDNNNLSGTPEVDDMSGFGGADRLFGSLGNDFLNGGSGFDFADYSGFVTPITVDAVSREVSTTGSIDELVDIEFIQGTPQADTFNADSTVEFVYYGGGENDTFNGSAINDSFHGEAGDDIFNSGGGIDNYFGGPGNDVFNGFGGRINARYDFASSGVNINFKTNTFSDGDGGFDVYNRMYRVFGSQHDDIMIADDTTRARFRGRDGDDDLHGGETLDFLYGEDGEDTLFGNGGNDELYGGNDNDILNGGDRSDKLFGEGGDDILNGDAGFDVLVGGAGNDDLNGGADEDTADYSSSTGPIMVDLSNNTASDGFGGTDTLDSVEYIIGSDFDDTITGDAANNYLRGGDGMDTLNGLTGNDTLDGQGDNDSLTSTSGFDTLIGGAGDDTITATGNINAKVSYETSTSGVTIDLKAGTASDGFGGTDTLVDIVRAEGSAHNDTITGSDVRDRLFGEDGMDTLLGGIGFDLLFGGNGDDILNGQQGSDDLTGGAGADTFILDDISLDDILDFNLADGDKVDIKALLAGYNPTSDAITNFVQITDNGVDSTLLIDQTGAGTFSTAVASIKNITNLTDVAALELNGSLITS